MRALLFAVSGLLLVVGLIFLGQGVGVIKGSSMTGEGGWAIVGGVCVVLAGLLTVFLFRDRVAKSAYEEERQP